MTVPCAKRRRLSKPETLSLEIIDNARNWLRIFCHCLVCKHQQECCPLGTKCELGRVILSCLLRDDCTGALGSLKGSFKAIVLHYLRCQNEQCPVCQRVLSNPYLDHLQRPSPLNSPAKPALRSPHCPGKSVSGEPSSREQLHALIRGFVQKPSGCASGNLSPEDIWPHMITCSSGACSHPTCAKSKSLLVHYLNCLDKNCTCCRRLSPRLAKPVSIVEGEGAAGGEPSGHLSAFSKFSPMRKREGSSSGTQPKADKPPAEDPCGGGHP